MRLGPAYPGNPRSHIGGESPHLRKDIRSSVASDAKVTALDDELKYTLTALEAIERFAKARRRPPSLRSIQRYCDEGTIRGTKIRTTFGQEWLINEQSLTTYIGSLPIEAVLLWNMGDEPGLESKARDQAMAKTAVKCDMCKDLAGGPACVRSCPTGAALRVSPEKFLDYTNAVGS